MARIPRLTAQPIIDAFFGSNAQSYAYTVTEDDFDEYDNEAPGKYYGIEVPGELAARWDDGINACRSRGIAPRGADGWRLRLEIMYHPDSVPEATVAAVEAYRIARERAAAEAAEAKERPRRAYEAGLARMAELTADLVGTGYGPSLYSSGSGWEVHWHTFCHVVDGGGQDTNVQRLGAPLLIVIDPIDGQRVRRVVWGTEHGYIVEDPSVHVSTHYVSPDLARQYRLKWARLNGVTVSAARADIDSPHIGQDQRAMYQAVIADANAR